MGRWWERWGRGERGGTCAAYEGQHEVALGRWQWALFWLLTLLQLMMMTLLLMTVLLLLLVLLLMLLILMIL